MTVRIGFINHSSSLYGANRSLVNLIEGLANYPVEPYVVLRERGELSSLLEKLGVTVAYVPFRVWVDAKRLSRLRAQVAKVVGEEWCYPRLWADEEHLQTISLLFKEWGIDLVQSNSAVIPVGIGVSRQLGIPHIWHLREFMSNYGFSYLYGEQQELPLRRTAGNGTDQLF